MRIAFAANPALGHVLPVLPLAIAARDAGHDVAFLAGASVGDAIRAAGLRHIVAGPPDLPTAFAMGPDRTGLTGRGLAAMIWGRVFGGVIAPQFAAALLALARDWRPDLVVHDDSEQGTWVAAERLGIPHVSLQATAWRSTGIRLSAAPLGELRTALGLPPDPGLARWHRHGYLTTRPESLQNPADPLPRAAVPIRPVPMDEAGGASPAGLEERDPGRRRVVVTMGTVLPGRLDTVAGILDALASLDVDVVATVGHGLDPAALRDRGPHVHVAGYVPMSGLLATADALVFHAGSGTMLAALAVGVPLVLLPVQADQPENADRCVAAGVGRALPAGARTTGDIREATRRVLDEPRYADAARRVRDEIARMPAPAEVLPALEALAAAGPDGTPAR